MSCDVSCGKLSCCDFGCFSGPDPIPPDGYVKVNGFSPQGGMTKAAIHGFHRFLITFPSKKRSYLPDFFANLAKS